MKVLLLVMLLLTLCSLSYGQSKTYNSFLKDPPKPTHKERDLAIASTAFYWAGTVADAYSSRGMREGNPLLGDGHGGLSMKRAIVAAEIPFVVSLILRHKHHSKAANWLMFGFGGAHFAVSAHNYAIK